MDTIGKIFKTKFSTMEVCAKIALRKNEYGECIGGLFSEVAVEELEKETFSMSSKSKLAFLKYVEERESEYFYKFRDDVDYEDCLNLESAQFIKEKMLDSILIDLRENLKKVKMLKRKGKHDERVLEESKIITALENISKESKDQMKQTYPKFMKNFTQYEGKELDPVDFDYSKLK